MERDMKEKADAKAYVCYTQKDNIRMNSSSGGVFYELAKYAIEELGAVVYGAGFSKDFTVQHMRIEKVEEIQILMRSKYVQSNIGSTFIYVREDLQQKRSVLFVGTPCQVKGLHKFLEVSKVDMKNLTTVDFICHGVPSPKVWKEYLEKLSAKYKSEIIDINFRDKSGGWHDFNMKVTFKNGEYKKSHYIDEYMFYYLRDYMTRSSCYKCQVRGSGNNVSDITIADSWQSKRESKKNDRGKSLVIIHTKKGKDFLWAVTPFMKIEEIDVPRNDEGMTNYEKKLDVRNEFFKEYCTYGLSKDIRKKYYGGNALRKIV